MNENKRVLNKGHYLLEVFSYVILIAGFAVAIAALASGKTMPQHIDFEGNAEGTSDAGVLLMISIVMLIVNAAISVLLHFFPFKSWNMPFKVKPEKERAVYGLIAYMVTIMEVLFAVFSLIFNILMSVAGGRYIMQVTMGWLVLLMLELIVFIVLATKRNSAV